MFVTSGTGHDLMQEGISCAVVPPASLCRASPYGTQTVPLGCC